MSILTWVSYVLLAPQHPVNFLVFKEEYDWTDLST